MKLLDLREKNKDLQKLDTQEINKPVEKVSTDNVAIKDNSINEDNDGFIMVQTKRNRRVRPSTVGTGTENSHGFESGVVRTWLYLGRVKKSVDNEIVVKYIKTKLKDDEDVLCEEVNPLGFYKSFKVGVTSKHHEELYKPEFWPTGTIVRRFNFFRPAHDRKQAEWVTKS